MLVQDGTVYFAAGRSSYLDGGMWVYGLNLCSGAMVHQTKLEGPWPDVANETGTPFAMEGAKPDLLVSDGKYLYMERLKFDAALQRQPAPVTTSLGALDMGGRHLLATGGFLDDSAFDRLFWMYSTHWPGYYVAQQAPNSGQLIVFDDRTTYCVSYFYRRQGLSPSFLPAADGYLLFADDSNNEPILVGKEGKPPAIQWLPVSAQKSGETSPLRSDISKPAVDFEKGPGYTRARPTKWQKLTPVRVRAMVLAGGRLFAAGPPDVVDAGDPYAALEGRRGSVLQIFSSGDGSLLKEQRFDWAPTFDGMSAAAGCLFVTTLDGKLHCLAGSKNY